VSAAGREHADGRLRAGTVGRAHGLDGSFHVIDVAASVFALVQLDSEIEVAGGTRRVVRLAGHAARPILRLDGAGSREDAEALRGQAIWVPRAVAPALEEDEWWAEDLEGCAVRDGERTVGTVLRLLALPSCEVLEVRWDDDPARPALLIPLVRDAVRDVDLETRVIDVDLGFLGEA
jgi:16S rRNA processing protein RimM